MGDFILDSLLNSGRRALGPCPSGEALMALAHGQPAPGASVDDLPYHLISCAACADRWELLQRDAHVDLVDLEALGHTAAHEFFALRVNDHVQRCRLCQSRRKLLDEMIHAPDRHSVHWSNLGMIFRQGAALPVHRGPRDNTVEAALTAPDGRPRIRRDRLERVELKVAFAEISKTGAIEVRLRVDIPCADVRLAIAVPSMAVMLPAVKPVECLAKFAADSRVPGDHRYLPASSLMAWVTTE